MFKDVEILTKDEPSSFLLCGITFIVDGGKLFVTFLRRFMSDFDVLDIGLSELCQGDCLISTVIDLTIVGLKEPAKSRHIHW